MSAIRHRMRDFVVEQFQSSYIAPSVDQSAFNCPSCGAFSRQKWFALDARPVLDGDVGDPRVLEAVSRALGHKAVPSFLGSECDHCHSMAIWRNGNLVWPTIGASPPPNPDLPSDIRADYKEASVILNDSPRGAAALLRLAIEKLCEHLNVKGRDLNQKIGRLVAEGLSREVQQALDVVRVIGNKAVHPGQIDLKDDRATALRLFPIVNFIAEEEISKLKRVQELYDSLPNGVRNGIQTRDGRNSAPTSHER